MRHRLLPLALSVSLLSPADAQNAADIYRQRVQQADGASLAYGACIVRTLGFPGATPVTPKA